MAYTKREYLFPFSSVANDPTNKVIPIKLKKTFINHQTAIIQLLQNIILLIITYLLSLSIIKREKGRKIE